MKDDFKEIESLIKSYHTIILSKKRMTKVKDEIILQKDKLKLLESKVEKEYSDVVRIENHPLKILFATILESEKRQFEKEKQEYLHAVLEYKECIKLIELLEYELEVLQTKSEDEKIVLKTIDDKLQSIDDIQISGDSIYLQELKTVNDELAQMLKLRVEIIDALELIQDIQNNFNAMISNLNRAKEMNTWGRYYREIQQAKQMKKSFIDEAHAYVHVIQKSLVYLQNEIHDVIVYQDFFRRTESFIRGFNLEYYNDLISDWIEDKNFFHTLTSTMSASSEISKFKLKLENIIQNTVEEYNLQEKRRSTLIEKIRVQNLNP